MKNIYSLFALSLLISSTSIAQTIWNGPTITFTKVNFADPSQAATQDRLTNNVWITRADTLGIYNAAKETIYSNFFSPEDTEWAFGTTADIATATFNNWETTITSNPPAMVNQDMILHLITDDIYIDIKFTQWTQGRNGGGFEYQRSTDPNVGITEPQAMTIIKIFPNPADNYLNVSGITESIDFAIIDITGTNVMQGQLIQGEKVDLEELKAGQYFLKTAKQTIPFSKN